MSTSLVKIEKATTEIQMVPYITLVEKWRGTFDMMDVGDSFSLIGLPTREIKSAIAQYHKAIGYKRHLKVSVKNKKVWRTK